MGDLPLPGPERESRLQMENFLMKGQLLLGFQSPFHNSRNNQLQTICQRDIGEGGKFCSPTHASTGETLPGEPSHLPKWPKPSSEKHLWLLKTKEGVEGGGLGLQRGGESLTRRWKSKGLVNQCLPHYAEMMGHSSVDSDL